MRGRSWAGRWTLALLGALGWSCAAAPSSPEPPAASFPNLPSVSARTIEVATASAASSLPRALVLRDGRLLDGTGAPATPGIDIVLDQGRIVAVQDEAVIPEGACVIDVAGRTVLPGFIDAHVHMSHRPAASYADAVARDVVSSAADRALRGAANARATLEAGFTTVRNLGGSLVDRSLRDAIAAGEIPGPRMLVANHAVGITGGHCDASAGLAPDVRPQDGDWRHGVADGPDAVRRSVRWQLKHGADVVKICVTGGVMSAVGQAGASQMTPAEIAAAVDEAHRAGRRVAAHAHGGEGIANAVRGGVDSIEHGSLLRRDTAAAMKARGIVLVPTLHVGEAVLERAEAGALSEASADKARRIVPRMRESFALALAEGVSVALGSDAGVFTHGHNAREFTAMVQAGLPEADAIVAGTSAAAALLGLSDVGVVAPGNVADLVVVGGDPLQDIRALEQPLLVVQSGRVVMGPQWDPGRCQP